MGNAGLFHSHFMMDAGKYADDNSWDAIKIDLKKRWKGNYRVEADRLYDTKRQSLDKTFEKNLFIVLKTGLNSIISEKTI
jgi:hypothetical protein